MVHLNLIKSDIGYDSISLTRNNTLSFLIQLITFNLNRLPFTSQISRPKAEGGNYKINKVFYTSLI